MIGRSFSILAICVTYRFGIEAMLAGEVFATGILVIVFLVAVSKKLRCKMEDQIYCMAPYFVAAAGSGLFTYTLAQWLDLPNIPELFATLISYSMTFLAIIFIVKTPLSQEISRTMGGRAKLLR